MKLNINTFILVHLTCFCATSFSQEQIEITKHNTFYIDGNAFLSNPYQTVYNSEYYSTASKDLFGLGLGMNLEIVATPKFSFAWNLGIHNLNTKDKIEFEPKPQDVFLTSVKIYNLIKINTGPTFFIGSKRKFEIGFNIDYGMIKKSITYNIPTGDGWQGSSVFEGKVNLGYRYINKNGLLLRTGFLFNKGIKDYNYYGGYLSLGYSFNKTLKVNPKQKPNSKQKTKSFFIINGMGYLFDFQLNLIGVGIGAEHFIYNTNRVNLGYSLLLKGGLGFYDSFPINIIPSGVLLYGLKEKSKLDIEIGANIPLIDIDKAQFYQFINFGIGYRYISNATSVRIGTSTTGILRMSIGMVLGRK